MRGDERHARAPIAAAMRAGMPCVAQGRALLRAAGSPTTAKQENGDVA
ncbi:MULTISPECIES: hypothetical protein [Xanthomonas]|nr:MULTISPECIES: hypothetical protein [unclassified Xanthomonas]MBO9872686.1 hypothetical protein [Xanthomonas sp. D-93]WNH46316.1 hypothetical protein PG878_07660 [Xanthomonas sp. A6251]